MAKLPISSIRTDGGTQPRMVMDHEAIEGYMDDMLAGVKFPPVIVFYDGTNYWLADGFHRRAAAFGAELKDIECEVRQGTLDDAQWFSFSANKSNGLRRTNEDKERAVKAALAHSKSLGLSDEKVAIHCGVSRHYVLEWRHKLKPLTCNLTTSQERPRLGADGRTINTANIGRKLEPKESTPRTASPAATVQTAPPARPPMTEQPRPTAQSAPAAPAPKDLVREATRIVFGSLASAVELAEAMASNGNEAAGVKFLEEINEFVSSATKKARGLASNN